jgi:hypothetical protein
MISEITFASDKLPLRVVVTISLDDEGPMHTRISLRPSSWIPPFVLTDVHGLFHQWLDALAKGKTNTPPIGWRITDGADMGATVPAPNHHH